MTEIAKPKGTKPKKMGVLEKIKFLRDALERNKALQEKRKKLKEKEVIKP